MLNYITCYVPCDSWLGRPMLEHLFTCLPKFGYVIMDVNRIKLAYKSVNQAQSWDDANDNKSAYCQYLRSLSDICHTLLQAAAAENVFPGLNNPDARNLLNVAKECLGRIEALGSKLDSNSNNNGSVNAKPQQLNPTDDQTSVVKNSVNENSVVIREEGFQEIWNSSVQKLSPKLEISGVSATANLRYKRNKELTPLEQVELDNQQLMAAYKARLARTHTIGAQTNLHLALQRRIAENVSLAWAKQKALAHANQERQKRLLDQASRKVSSSISDSSSKEEEMRKQLYAKILEYEQDEDWTLRYKEKLKIDPRDLLLIDCVVKQTLSVPEHPLFKYMTSLQIRIYDKVTALLSYVRNSDHESATLSDRVESHVVTRVESEPIIDVSNPLDSKLVENIELSPLQLFDPIKVDKTCARPDVWKNEIEKLPWEHSDSSFGESGVTQWLSLECMKDEALIRHVRNIVLDVRDAMDKLLDMLILTYDQLDSAEGRDQSYASMEEPFFKPIWPPLRQLFRLAYTKEEKRMEIVMSQLSTITLKELGVSQNYWGDENEPYQAAVNQMKNIGSHCCPLKKLEVLVQVAHLICEDRSRPPASKSVGADDLIPILCFVVLQAKLPELISECHAMEQFLHEGYLMGEEGYCLTSMQTVFQYLQSQIAVVP